MASVANEIDSTEEFTPIICGQFVDRILSTLPITNGKGWEEM